MTTTRSRLLGQRWRSLTVLLGALVLLVVAVDASRSPSAAQGQTSEIRIEVADLDTVLGPGLLPAPGDEPPSEEQITYSGDLTGRILVENHGQTTVDGLRLVVEVHPEARTRGLLRQALRGVLPTQPLTVSGQDVRDGRPIEPGEIAGLDVAIDEDTIAWPEDPGGVHPVRITLLRGTQVVDEVVTAVTWLAQRPPEPVAVSILWPFDASPWRGAGGIYPQGVDRDIRAGGRLDALLGAVERRPAPGVTLAPAPHLLEDLAERSGGFLSNERREDGSLEQVRVESDREEAVLAARTLRRLRAVSADSLPSIAGSYADADLAALLEAGGAHAELASSAAAAGRQRLTALLGGEVDPAMFVLDGPLRPAMLDVIPASTVVLRPEAAGLPDLGSDPPLGSSVRNLQAPSGRLLDAVIADPYLEEVLTEDPPEGGPLVLSQHLLAHTAMFHLEAPNRGNRALLLYPPTGWAPGVASADAVLQSLHDAPWLTPVPVGDLPTRATRDPLVLELPTPTAASAFDQEFLAELADARNGLTALIGALPDPDARINGRTVQDLEDDLLRATSRWYEAGDTRALVRDVDRTVERRLGSVEVTTGTVTLTSDTGQIPVTVQRTRGGPVDVVVSVESQGRVLWPEGRRSDTLTLDDGGSQTVSFTARALSTGTFPVTVRVTDPAGLEIVTETTVSVRSTAISGPALIGTGVLVAILLIIGAGRRRPGGRPTDGSTADRPRLTAVDDERSTLTET
ncbi:MAG: hypothetical protein JJT89_13450 [Nitriliruptoraceae bacterium]|nr:hypothetical protein [Nitriliruptoraceae bacterium]